MGREFIVIDGDVAQERYFPFGVEPVGQKCLIIEIRRVVIAFRVERTEQGGIGFIPESVEL